MGVTIPIERVFALVAAENNAIRILWTEEIVGFGRNGAPIAEGAGTSVYLASAEVLVNVSGKYFIDCKPAEPSRQARDEELAERLWEKSEALLQPYLASAG